MVKKKVGRPPRYTIKEEKKIVNIYKKIRKDHKTEIRDLKQALKKYPSLQPIPVSKHFYCNLFKKYGLSHYRLKTGQIITSKIEAQRFKNVKALRRRTKAIWRNNVYFFDIKKWSIRASKNQKDFNRSQTKRGVFRTNQEDSEPWSSKPHSARNRPGSHTVCVGVVVGNGEVFAAGVLPQNYTNEDIAKYVRKRVKPEFEKRGIDKSFFFRRDCDPAFTRKAKEAFDELPCKNDLPVPHMQDIMPHDFSIWKEANRHMLENEAKWSKTKYSQTETKNAWIKRLINTLEGLDSEYIYNTCDDVYRRVQEIYQLKGKRPRD